MKQIILSITLAMAAATNLAAQSSSSQQTFYLSDYETVTNGAENDDKMVSTATSATNLICQNTTSQTSEDQLSSDVKADNNDASVLAKEGRNGASLTSRYEADKQSQAEDNLASYMLYKQQVFRQ